MAQLNFGGSVENVVTAALVGVPSQPRSVSSPNGKSKTISVK